MLLIMLKKAFFFAWYPSPTIPSFAFVWMGLFGVLPFKIDFSSTILVVFRAAFAVDWPVSFIYSFSFSSTKQNDRSTAAAARRPTAAGSTSPTLTRWSTLSPRGSRPPLRPRPPRPRLLPAAPCGRSCTTSCWSRTWRTCGGAGTSGCSSGRALLCKGERESFFFFFEI